MRGAEAKGHLRILVVDDHALVREGLWHVLHELRPSMDVVEAGSSAEARARLTSSTFDLVLLDYYLPDSEGTKALDELLPLAGAAPTLTTTANATDFISGQYFSDTDTILCTSLKAFA